MAAILCHVTTNFSKPNRNLEMSKSINPCDINLYLIKVLFVVHALLGWLVEACFDVERKLKPNDI